MDREFCLENKRLCLRLAWQALDDETRETYVRIAHTWEHEASFFIDPDREASDDST